MRNPHGQQSLWLPADLPDLPLICHWSARSARSTTYLPVICQICQWSARSAINLPDLQLICHWSAISASDLPVICQIYHLSASDLPDLPLICQICHWSVRSATDLPYLPLICHWRWPNVITSRLFLNFPPHHHGCPTCHPKTLIGQKKNVGKIIISAVPTAYIMCHLSHVTCHLSLNLF